MILGVACENILMFCFFLKKITGMSSLRIGFIQECLVYVTYKFCICFVF